MSLPSKRKELRVRKKEINSMYKTGEGRVKAWEEKYEGENLTKLQLKKIFGWRQGGKIFRKSNPKIVLHPTKNWRNLVKAKKLLKAARIAEKKGSTKISLQFKQQAIKLLEELNSIKSLIKAKKIMETINPKQALKIQEKINELKKQKQEKQEKENK